MTNTSEYYYNLRELSRKAGRISVKEIYENVLALGNAYRHAEGVARIEKNEKQADDYALCADDFLTVAAALENTKEINP